MKREDQSTPALTLLGWNKAEVLTLTLIGYISSLVLSFEGTYHTASLHEVFNLRITKKNQVWVPKLGTFLILSLNLYLFILKSYSTNLKSNLLIISFFFISKSESEIKSEFHYLFLKSKKWLFVLFVTNVFIYFIL